LRANPQDRADLKFIHTVVIANRVKQSSALIYNEFFSTSRLTQFAAKGSFSQRRFNQRLPNPLLTPPTLQLDFSNHFIGCGDKFMHKRMPGLQGISVGA
jgi:hypothetical protein